MGKAKQNGKGFSKALTISHPNSRKAVKLSKQAIKLAAREKSKRGYAIKKNVFGQKLLWFRDNLEPNASLYSAEMFDTLIEKYLMRFDEELEQIEIKHSIGQRKGRQHASREDIIKMTISREREEYNTSGIEIANILMPDQLEILKEWDADLNKLPNFVVKRISKQFLKNYKAPQHQRVQTKGEKNENQTKAKESKNQGEVLMFEPLMEVSSQ